MMLLEGRRSPGAIMEIGFALVLAVVVAVSLLALALALLAPALAQERARSPFQDLFDQSLKEKKGLTREGPLSRRIP